MKQCTICKRDKDLKEFFKHKKMPDGHINQCKECRKKQDEEKRKDIEWIKKERDRGREKYHRLYKHKNRNYEYKEKADLKYFQKYPEKLYAKRAINSLQSPMDGFNRHHWSYKKEHATDVIELSIENHMKLHRYMIYDQERMLYRTLNGILLDTKEKHIEYMSIVLRIEEQEYKLKCNKDINS